MKRINSKDESPSVSTPPGLPATTVSSAGKLRVTPEGGLRLFGEGLGDGKGGKGGQQGDKQKFFATRSADGKWNLLMAPTSDPSKLFLVEPAPGHRFQVAGGSVRMESTASTGGGAANGCGSNGSSSSSSASPDISAPSTTVSVPVAQLRGSSTVCAQPSPHTATAGTPTSALTTSSMLTHTPPLSPQSDSPKKPSFFKSRSSKDREALKVSAQHKVLAAPSRKGSKSPVQGSPPVPAPTPDSGKKTKKSKKSGKVGRQSPMQDLMTQNFSLMSVSPSSSSEANTSASFDTATSTAVTTSCMSLTTTVSSSVTSTVTTTTSSSASFGKQMTSSVASPSSSPSHAETGDSRSSLHATQSSLTSQKSDSYSLTNTSTLMDNERSIVDKHDETAFGHPRTHPKQFSESEKRSRHSDGDLVNSGVFKDSARQRGTSKDLHHDLDRSHTPRSEDLVDTERSLGDSSKSSKSKGRLSLKKKSSRKSSDTSSDTPRRTLRSSVSEAHSETSSEHFDFVDQRRKESEHCADFEPRKDNVGVSVSSGHSVVSQERASSVGDRRERPQTGAEASQRLDSSVRHQQDADADDSHSEMFPSTSVSAKRDSTSISQGYPQENFSSADTPKSYRSKKSKGKGKKNKTKADLSTEMNYTESADVSGADVSSSDVSRDVVHEDIIGDLTRKVEEKKSRMSKTHTTGSADVSGGDSSNTDVIGDIIRKIEEKKSKTHKTDADVSGDDASSVVIGDVLSRGKKEHSKTKDKTSKMTKMHTTQSATVSGVDVNTDVIGDHHRAKKRKSELDRLIEAQALDAANIEAQEQHTDNVHGDTSVCADTKDARKLRKNSLTGSQVPDAKSKTESHSKHGDITQQESFTESSDLPHQSDLAPDLLAEKSETHSESSTLDQGSEEPPLLSREVWDAKPKDSKKKKKRKNEFDIITAQVLESQTSTGRSSQGVHAVVKSSKYSQDVHADEIPDETPAPGPSKFGVDDILKGIDSQTDSGAEFQTKNPKKSKSKKSRKSHHKKLAAPVLEGESLTADSEESTASSLLPEDQTSLSVFQLPSVMERKREPSKKKRKSELDKLIESQQAEAAEGGEESTSEPSLAGQELDMKPVHEERPSRQSKESAKQKMKQTGFEGFAYNADEFEKIHSQGKLESQSQEKMASQSQGKMESQSEGKMELHSQEKMASHSQGKMESQSQKIESQIQEKMRSHCQEMMASHSQEKMASHSQEKMASHSQEKMASHSQEKMASHSQEKMASHSQEKMESHSQEESSLSELTPVNAQKESYPHAVASGDKKETKKKKRKSALDHLIEEAQQKQDPENSGVDKEKHPDTTDHYQVDPEKEFGAPVTEPNVAPLKSQVEEQRNESKKKKKRKNAMEAVIEEARKHLESEEVSSVQQDVSESAEDPEKSDQGKTDSEMLQLRQKSHTSAADLGKNIFEMLQPAQKGPAARDFGKPDSEMVHPAQKVPTFEERKEAKKKKRKSELDKLIEAQRAESERAERGGAQGDHQVDPKPSAGAAAEGEVSKSVEPVIAAPPAVQDLPSEPTTETDSLAQDSESTETGESSKHSHGESSRERKHHKKHKHKKHRHHHHHHHHHKRDNLKLFINLSSSRSSTERMETATQEDGSSEGPSSSFVPPRTSREEPEHASRKSHKEPEHAESAPGTSGASDRDTDLLTSAATSDRDNSEETSTWQAEESSDPGHKKKKKKKKKLKIYFGGGQKTMMEMELPVDIDAADSNAATTTHADVLAEAESTDSQLTLPDLAESDQNSRSSFEPRKKRKKRLTELETLIHDQERLSRETSENRELAPEDQAEANKEASVPPPAEERSQESSGLHQKGHKEPERESATRTPGGDRAEVQSEELDKESKESESRKDGDGDAVEARKSQETDALKPSQQQQKETTHQEQQKETPSSGQQKETPSSGQQKETANSQHTETTKPEQLKESPNPDQQIETPKPETQTETPKPETQKKKKSKEDKPKKKKKGGKKGEQAEGGEASGSKSDDKLHSVISKVAKPDKKKRKMKRMLQAAGLLEVGVFKIPKRTPDPVEGEDTATAPPLEGTSLEKPNIEADAEGKPKETPAAETSSLPPVMSDDSDATITDPNDVTAPEPMETAPASASDTEGTVELAPSPKIAEPVTLVPELEEELSPEETARRALKKYLTSRSFTESELASTFGAPYVVLERLSEKEIHFMGRRYRNARVSSRAKCTSHCRERTLEYLCQLKLIECSRSTGSKRLEEALLTGADHSYTTEKPSKTKKRKRKSTEEGDATEEGGEKKKRKRKKLKDLAGLSASGDVPVIHVDTAVVGDQAKSQEAIQAARSLLNTATTFPGFTGGQLIRLAPRQVGPSILSKAPGASGASRTLITIPPGAVSSMGSLPRIVTLPSARPPVTSSAAQQIILPPIPALSASSSLKDATRDALAQAINNSLRSAAAAAGTSTSLPGLHGPISLGKVVSATVTSGATGTTSATTMPKQFIVVQMGDKRVLVPVSAISTAISGTSGTTSLTTATPAVSFASAVSSALLRPPMAKSLAPRLGLATTTASIIPTAPRLAPPICTTPGSVARIVLSNRRNSAGGDAAARAPTASTLLFARHPTSSAAAIRPNTPWAGPRAVDSSQVRQVLLRSGHPIPSITTGAPGIRVVLSGSTTEIGGQRFTLARPRTPMMSLLRAAAPTTPVTSPGRPGKPGKRVMTEEERLRKRARLEKKYPLPPGVVIKTEPVTSGYSDEPKTVQAPTARVFVSTMNPNAVRSLSQSLPVMSAIRSGSPIIIRQAAGSGARSSTLGPLIIRVPSSTAGAATSLASVVSRLPLSAASLVSGGRLPGSLLSGVRPPGTLSFTLVNATTGTPTVARASSLLSSSSLTAASTRTVPSIPSQPPVTSVDDDDDDIYIVDSPPSVSTSVTASTTTTTTTVAATTVGASSTVQSSTSASVSTTSAEGTTTVTVSSPSTEKDSNVSASATVNASTSSTSVSDPIVTISTSSLSTTTASDSVVTTTVTTSSVTASSSTVTATVIPSHSPSPASSSNPASPMPAPSASPAPSHTPSSSPGPLQASRMASLGAMLARRAVESGSLPGFDTSSLQSERMQRLRETLLKNMANMSDERRTKALQALHQQVFQAPASPSPDRGTTRSSSGSPAVVEVPDSPEARSRESSRTPEARENAPRSEQPRIEIFRSEVDSTDGSIVQPRIEISRSEVDPMEVSSGQPRIEISRSDVDATEDSVTQPRIEIFRSEVDATEDSIDLPRIEIFRSEAQPMEVSSVEPGETRDKEDRETSRDRELGEASTASKPSAKTSLERGDERQGASTVGQSGTNEAQPNSEGAQITTPVSVNNADVDEGSRSTVGDSENTTTSGASNKDTASLAKDKDTPTGEKDKNNSSSVDSNSSASSKTTPSGTNTKTTPTASSDKDATGDGEPSSETAKTSEVQESQKEGSGRSTDSPSAMTSKPSTSTDKGESESSDDRNDSNTVVASTSQHVEREIVEVDLDMLSDLEKELSAHDEAVSTNDESLSTNDVSVPGKDKPLSAKDKSPSADDQSTSANDKALSEKDKSQSANAQSQSSKDKPKSKEESVRPEVREPERCASELVSEDTEQNLNEEVGSRNQPSSELTASKDTTATVVSEPATDEIEIEPLSTGDDSRSERRQKSSDIEMNIDSPKQSETPVDESRPVDKSTSGKTTVDESREAGTSVGKSKSAKTAVAESRQAETSVGESRPAEKPVDESRSTETPMDTSDQQSTVDKEGERVSEDRQGKSSDETEMDIDKTQEKSNKDAGSDKNVESAKEEVRSKNIGGEPSSKEERSKNISGEPSSEEVRSKNNSGEPSSEEVPSKNISDELKVSSKNISGEPSSENLSTEANIGKTSSSSEEKQPEELSSKSNEMARTEASSSGKEKQTEDSGTKSNAESTRISSETASVEVSKESAGKSSEASQSVELSQMASPSISDENEGIVKESAMEVD